MIISKNSLVLFLFISITSLFAADNSDPSWVHLQRASNFIERKDFANALTEARKARNRRIEEELDVYWEEINKNFPEKTRYELIRMKQDRESVLRTGDNYPQYNYIIADIYAGTNFLDEAEKEYRKALDNGRFLDYPDQIIEIKYKLASLYNKKGSIFLEEMMYRDILKDFFKQRNQEYWDRIRYNIREDLTLNYVFKIYRLDGMKYLEALYKLGRHEAIMQRRNESLFLLSCAAIVWMTYYGNEIKKTASDFQFEGPVDFINYINNQRFLRYINEDFIVDKLMFYIGYNHFINRDYEISSHYFKLSLIYAERTGRTVMLRDKINYLSNNKDHVLTYEEIL